MKNQFARTLAGIFLLCRLIFLISISLDGLRGFGDFVHFYRLAQMGLPFIQIWVEFPPVFPFISWFLYHAAGGREHIYDILMVMALSLAQAATLVVFYRLAVKVRRAEAAHDAAQNAAHDAAQNAAHDAAQNAAHDAAQNAAQIITLVYAAILMVLPYGWWYFDALPVLLILLGLQYLLEDRDVNCAVALGAGFLTKLFPVLLLPLVLKTRSTGQAARVVMMTAAIITAAYLPLWLASPELTLASIRSQASKGSWETVWALLDGNQNTGNFGPELERYEPSNASQLRGNPPKISPWITLLPFAALGSWFYRRARLAHARAVIAFAGLTWCIFSIWSPGYSPQWVLYLLPLVLLVLPERQAVLMAFSLVFINLLEWPVLLSRGYNWGLWLTISMRTFLWVVLSFVFWSQTKSVDNSSNQTEVDWKTAGQA